MILLLHPKVRKYQGWISRYIRTVTYENIEEVPGRLRAMAIGRADVRAQTGPIPERGPAEPENKDGQQRRLDLPEEDVLNPSDGEAPVDNVGHEEASPSPEEVQAVLAIETAYHRVLTRRKEVLKRARLWSLLHDRTSSMEWPRDKHYKLLMQGPLVHVLMCLDDVKMFADQTNRDSKRQLQGDDHTKLEELIERSDSSR